MVKDREGTLKETSNAHEDEEENNVEETDEDELEEVLENYMSNVLKDVGWKEDNWVAVCYGYQWFPGVVYGVTFLDSLEVCN